MKITKIEIKDFHQFKDLTIDLTYPKGHTKEGQPLDKVCFIGQSGTGKTSLLELIPKFIYDYGTRFIRKLSNVDFENKLNAKIVFGLQNQYSANLTIDDMFGFFSLGNWKDDLENLLEIEISDYYYSKWLTDVSNKSIYFPATLNFDIEFGTEYKLKDSLFIDFGLEKVASVWSLLLVKIQKYQERELQIRQEISKTVEQSSNSLEIIQKALKNLEDFKKVEFNPIEDIAENCLNPLLLPFKLRVKTDLDIKSKEDIGFIKVEDFNGNEIPHGLWSTGTKQVILSALPLYLLKPKHSVVLFDEPERSLYPDMQRFIVDYYAKLTDNCQFFYATHSPIIASNFEPWEIVELKFNKEGYIYREQYYEGENHVDNYKWNPKHMRWDDILQRIFDMEDDGSPDRKILLDELASKNVKYKKLKKLGKEDSDEAKEIIKRISYLSKELSKWELAKWD